MKRTLIAAVLSLTVAPAFGQSLLGIPTPILTLPAAPVLDLADPVGSVPRLLSETSIPALGASGLPALDLPLDTLQPLSTMVPALQP